MDPPSPSSPSSFPSWSHFSPSCSVPPVPSPPTPSASTRSTPEGFVLPRIPPNPDPLHVTVDTNGRYRIPVLSHKPLPVHDRRVTAIIRHFGPYSPKCSNCLELCVACEPSEHGIPCASCILLGIPDCEHADFSHFFDSVRRDRDASFVEDRDALVRRVESNQLPHSRFEREFAKAAAWFYSAAQGALDRFLLNVRATRDIAINGYRALAASSNHPATLLRFILLGLETRVHPAVLHVVGSRAQDLIAAML
ncbi:hypothetical protein C8R44DRAFT_743024 [Mycena epipterygia]|nr:hypothetical protein C8R44DRAFT_743024 [Mycena epipterygia]